MLMSSGDANKEATIHFSPPFFLSLGQIFRCSMPGHLGNANTLCNNFLSISRKTKLRQVR